MKTIAHFFTIVFFLFGSLNIFSQGVAINTNGTAADNSAMLDVSSTSKGILIPRMDIAQRNLIGTPETGLLITKPMAVRVFIFIMEVVGWL